MNNIILLLIAFIALSPLKADAAEWWKVQLEVEAENLALYGHQLGENQSQLEFDRKVQERIAIANGEKPWYQIQLEQEARYMVLYGNPCGKEGCNPKPVPIASPAPILGRSEPVAPTPLIETPAETVEEVIEEPIEENMKISMWLEDRGFQGTGMKPYLHLKAEWEGTETGSLFCVSPNFPHGAYLFKEEKSGYVEVEPVEGWKTGDTSVCTWKVGDEEVTKTFRL